MPDFKDTYGGQLAMQTGSSAANGLIGGIMGQLFAKSDDKRQIKQAGKLQALQIQGNKEMIDYQKAKDLEMWKLTSYPGQLEMMEAAGINPALMYGQGGGGGTTTGGSASVNGHGAQARSEAVQGMGMMMQQALTQAQIENIKAQTEKTKAETEYTKGPQTAKTTMDIQDIAQGIENKKSEKELTEVQTAIQNIQKQVQGATIEDQIDYIVQQARQMTGLASQALIQANLDTDARDTRLKTIKAEFVKVLLTNALLKSQKKNVDQSTEESKKRVNLMDQQITNMVQELMIDWDRLGEEKARTRIAKMFADYGTDPTNDILKSITNGIGAIIPLGANKAMNAPERKNPVGFRQ